MYSRNVTVTLTLISTLTFTLALLPFPAFPPRATLSHLYTYTPHITFTPQICPLAFAQVLQPGGLLEDCSCHVHCGLHPGLGGSPWREHLV